MNKHVYMDNSSTTRPFPEVTKIVMRYMDEDYGNPSSLHHMGLVAEKALKTARKQTARAAGTLPENVYFTSGGTEADNLAIIGTARANRRRGKKIITAVHEHPAVLNAFRSLESEGFEAVYIESDRNGYIRLDQLEDEITDDTILVSCMHVNNESGAIQPVEKIASVISETNSDTVFHVDAVQSFGKLALPVKDADLISISGHKIHGPMGTGALIVNGDRKLTPLIYGGGQEKDIRPGTENLPAIAGFGLAAEMITNTIDKDAARMQQINDHLRAGLLSEIRDIRINSPEGACPSVLNVSFLGTRGEVILHTLEQDGIFVSTGSACSSNHGGGSHVLKAMGLTDEEITGAIRFSFGRFNTLEETDYVIEKTAAAVSRFRMLGSFR